MKKVLLVLDDEAGVRHDLSHWLSLMDFTVHTAGDATEAKRIVSSEHVDFAIVDLKIDFNANMGGIEVLRFLRCNHPETRAVILSAYDFTDDIKNAVHGLCDGFVSKGGEENYIRAIASKIKALASEHTRRHCFVIMPFSRTRSCRSEEWAEIYINVIKPAVELAGLNYECTRSDGLAGSIIEDVLEHLNRADLVIADLTDRNPNVFYELGVRHALRRGTVLITQRITDVPFDLRSYAIQEYRWKTAVDRQAFAVRLREVLQELETSPARGASPVLKYLGKP